MNCQVCVCERERESGECVCVNVTESWRVTDMGINQEVAAHDTMPRAAG